MENLSGLRPKGVAVLVKPYTVAKKGSLIAIPASVRAQTDTVDNRVVVVEVGPEAWKDEAQPRAVAGDHVLITKFAGFMIKPEDTLDGESYRVVNDRDIFCGIPAKELA